jgi:hypothetical protein
MPDETRYDWSWRYDRMSFAIVQGDEGNWAAGPYSEESYFACEIEVRPALAETSTVNAQSIPSARQGRPPKWDWEAAMAYVVACANTPDGLETGPGAQAAIERLIADFFIRSSDDSTAPCESETRKRASRIVKAMANFKGGLVKAA